MSWCPFAIKRDIGRGHIRHTPVRMVAHTAVVSSAALAPGTSGPFWHFYIGPTGQLYQYVDTDYRAGAETMPGADGSISWESWDGYREDSSRRPIPLDAYGVTGWRHTTDVPAWTAAQVDTIRRLITWLWDTHPTIPRQMATTSRDDTTSHGLAWHRLGVPASKGATTSQTGGIVWSSSAGKVCPGERRTNQLHQIYAELTGTTQEDPMAQLTDDQITRLNAAADRILGSIPAGWARTEHRVADDADNAAVLARLDAIAARLDAIEAGTVHVDPAKVAEQLTIVAKD